ncbi:hypothetical protein PUN28_019087 [Cardiocondyla obscurior]|uniref:Uncharacterized protein n=1 Tax=Cardiocondyla obscurior TaxID=286306 RepID=A0AAW2EDA1_9HYME
MVLILPGLRPLTRAAFQYYVGTTSEGRRHRASVVIGGDVVVVVVVVARLRRGRCQAEKRRRVCTGARGDVPVYLLAARRFSRPVTELSSPHPAVATPAWRSDDGYYIVGANNERLRAPSSKQGCK